MKKINYKSMKKAILTLVLLFVTNVFFGQQSLFDKFEDQDNVTAVIVNQKMFQLMSKMKVDDKETQQYVNLIKKLDNLKVFVTNNSGKAGEMKSVADKYLKSANLEELMRVNQGGKSVKIYVRSGSKDTLVKELFMFVEGAPKEQTVLLSLTGEFDLNDISVLTDKMNLPGGDDLKKASKGKK
jgi:hypothetical protein